MSVERSETNFNDGMASPASHVLSSRPDHVDMIARALPPKQFEVFTKLPAEAHSRLFLAAYMATVDDPTQADTRVLEAYTNWFCHDYSPAEAALESNVELDSLADFSQDMPRMLDGYINAKRALGTASVHSLATQQLDQTSVEPQPTPGHVIKVDFSGNAQAATEQEQVDEAAEVANEPILTGKLEQSIIEILGQETYDKLGLTDEHLPLLARTFIDVSDLNKFAVYQARLADYIEHYMRGESTDQLLEHFGVTLSALSVKRKRFVTHTRNAIDSRGIDIGTVIKARIDYANGEISKEELAAVDIKNGKDVQSRAHRRREQQVEETAPERQPEVEQNTMDTFMNALKPPQNWVENQDFRNRFDDKVRTVINRSRDAGLIDSTGVAIIKVRLGLAPPLHDYTERLLGMPVVLNQLSMLASAHPGRLIHADKDPRVKVMLTTLALFTKSKLPIDEIGKKFNQPELAELFLKGAVAETMLANIHHAQLNQRH